MEVTAPKREKEITLVSAVMDGRENDVRKVRTI